MRKWRLMAVAVCVWFGLAACELDASSNGELDGYWHLEQIDTLATGGTNDLSGELLFWAVQGKILTLSNQKIGYIPVVMRFNRNGDRLVLSEPQLYDRDKGNQPLTDTDVLKVYGIHELTMDWKVEQLTGSTMILSSNLVKIRLKKF